MRTLPQAALILLAALTAAGGAQTGHPETPPTRFTSTQPRLGTRVSIVLYAPDAGRATTAFGRAWARLEQLDAIMSDYREDSELSRLNQSAPHSTPVAVSPELAHVLRTAWRIGDASEGAFDVSVGPLTRLWRRARRRKELPAADRLNAARKLVGLEHWEADAERSAVCLRQAGMRLDLGGIAKGYIVDEMLRVLAEAGIQSALVNAGGDIGVSNPPPGAQAWRVGVAALDPRRVDGVIALANAAIATSGDAFQSVTIDGKSYSHIVDPRTGVGLNQSSSVTVLAPKAELADAWASALSVLGAERGLPRLSRQPQLNARIVWLDARGQLVVRQSRSFPEIRPQDD